MVSKERIYQDLKNTNKIEDYKSIIKRVEIFDNLYDASKNSDCITILTEWDEFKNIDWNKIKKLIKGPLILADGRNIIDHVNIKNLKRYISVGNTKI